MITGGTPRLLRKLRSGAARPRRCITLPIDDQALATVPVIREELLLVMPAGHRLASGNKPIPPEALVRQPFILFENGLEHAPRRSTSSSSAPRFKPRVVAETENVEIIKSMVASGLGISIVPFQSVAREIARRIPAGRADRGPDARPRNRLGPPRDRTACPAWCGK